MLLVNLWDVLTFFGCVTGYLEGCWVVRWCLAELRTGSAEFMKWNSLLATALDWWCDHLESIVIVFAIAASVDAQAIQWPACYKLPCALPLSMMFAYVLAGGGHGNLLDSIQRPETLGLCLYNLFGRSGFIPLRKPVWQVRRYKISCNITIWIFMIWYNLSLLNSKVMLTFSGDLNSACAAWIQ